MTQRLQNSLQAAVKLLLSFLLLTIWSEQASAWDYEAVKRIESATALPQQPDREVVVTRYGASPKASAVKNQKAINRAIAEIAKSGGGRVVIPAGTWHTGALRLLSHVNLVVSKDATLCFVFDTKLYPLVKTSWEGLECWNYSPCIYAREATDIAITGEGTIDGGGSNATWWAMCGKKHYGYKGHVKVDKKSKLVESLQTTDASVHDSNVIEQLITEDDKGQRLYLDAGYVGKEDVVKRCGMRPVICEKGYRNHPLTKKQKRRNCKRSKRRCRIEHVFGFIEGAMHGSLVRSIGIVRASANFALTCLTYNIFRYVQINKYQPQLLSCKE